MSEIVFGEIDWNSGDAGASGSKTEFMRLEQGTNTVRIMGNPHQYYVHWLELDDGTKRKVSSPLSDPDLLKKLEEEDFRRKPRWIIKVLDRSDDTFKLLEIGSQIYNGIRALYNNAKWGKVTEYDIDIIRGKPGSNPLYSVQPNPREKLDAQFKEAFMEFNDSVNIDALTRPEDPSVVKELLGWDDGASSSSSDSLGGDSFDDDIDFSFE